MHSSYNCVLSSVYNYLTIVHKEQFPFEYIYLTEDFFKFIHYDGCLVAQHPEEVSLRFLNRAGFEMVFPPIKDESPREIFDFVDNHLRNKGPLPMAINLRYSVLDPTNFDQDYWNFQLIVKGEDSQRYKMFDMFHGKFYEMDKEHLLNAIRTSFNYRMEGRFTPFMVINRINAEPVSTVIRATIPQLVRTALEVYDLEKQKEEVDKFLEMLQKRYLNHTADSLYNEIYRVMGYQVIIANSRKQFLKTLRSEGDYQAGKLDEWVQKWEKLNQSVPSAISRRSMEEYRSLRERFLEVLKDEFGLIHEVIGKGGYL